MPRPRFQFSLKSLMTATMLVAVGLTCLLQSTGPLLHFATTIALAGASFGAAVGLAVDRVLRYTAYGFVLAGIFVLYLPLLELAAHHVVWQRHRSVPNSLARPEANVNGWLFRGQGLTGIQGGHRDC